jgi:hypothetical protein
MDNATIATRLLEHALALEANGHTFYRVRAYRRAASLVKMLPRSLQDVVQEGGRDALAALPGIGSHLAVTLEALVNEGRLRTLGPKPEETDPEERLTSLPGVGAVTALRMREELGIDSVAEVEDAVEEGRLERVGVGAKRLRGIRAVLRQRQEEKGETISTFCEPSVEDLLAVDEEYRAVLDTQDSRQGEEVGAPVLKTTRGGWNFQVTLSPSPLAYRLGRQRDWVLIRFDAGPSSGERTVVTETRQPLAGQRVVRGRERECGACWAS